MGSGKSVVGALLAERTGAPFHDLDRMIENASESCAGAVYAPFPELEKMTR